MVAQPDSTNPQTDLPGLCLAVTEHAPLPIATVEGATHIVRYVNPAFCRMMNKPAEELVGKALSDLLPEKDECVRLLDRVFLHQKPESFTEHDTSNPHPVFWSYTMWPVLAEELLVGIMIQVTETAPFHGMTVAMNEALVFGSLRQHELAESAEKLNAQLRAEITERKQAEEALRTSDERFRTLFELGPVAVYSCDAAGLIQEFNRRAEELWGRTPEAYDTDERFCGSFKMFRPDGTVMPHKESPMAEIVAGKLASVNDAEVLIERPDGSHVSVIANIRPLKNEHGKVIGAINCFYDISDRKRYELEREAFLANEQSLRIESESANRAKDIFLATLSHEMRTPLNAILGWAAIMGQEGCTPEEFQEGIRVIERNVHAQTQLINDVLDVSRIVSGKLQLEIVPTELTVLMKDAVDVVRAAAAAKNIKIKLDLGPVAGRIPCDPHRIRQVFWNLLTNAVKFTPKDGTITIKLSQDRFNARIDIGDNGQGITADLLPFVFERFRQGEGGTKRQHGGLGLGLSIVKNLIELHGGEISVTSEGAGRGSLFTINLPLPASVPELSASTPKPAQPPRLDGLRILVVDDEPDARNLLVKVLKEVGALAVSAGSVPEALHLIETTPPQILLSDIAMPSQDGYDFIRLVRKAGHRAKDLPAVAITAFVHKDDVRQALLAGFQMHVAKPVSVR
jgi:PAS domain S-box-containing protein